MALGKDLIKELYAPENRTYDGIRKILAQINSKIYDSSQAVVSNQKTESAFANIRKKLEGTQGSTVHHKSEYLGIVIRSNIDVKPPVVHVDIPSYDIEGIVHYDQFWDPQNNLKTLEHKAFYPESVSSFMANVPREGHIVRVKVSPNYFSSTLTNPQDNRYIGIFDENLFVEPSVSPNVVEVVKTALSLFKSAYSTATSSISKALVGKSTVTDRSLASLDSEMQGIIIKFLKKARAAGYPVVIASGTRTNQEQEKIYAQGRTTPGKVVTQAMPGQSAHNFGLAIDFAFADAKGRPTWPEDGPWREVGEIGKSLGLEWGGDWPPKIADRPHLQLSKWKQVAKNWKKSGALDYAVVGDKNLKFEDGLAAPIDNNKQLLASTQPIPKAADNSTKKDTKATPASNPTGRPKLKIIDFITDMPNGIKMNSRTGTTKIKVREDIALHLQQIKGILNAYGIPLNCEYIDARLENKEASLLGRIGLQVNLNFWAALSPDMNIETDDYLVGPDYSKPFGDNCALKIYAKCNKISTDIDFTADVIYESVDIYNIKQSINASEPVIIKTSVPLIDLTKLFEDRGFVHALPKKSFFKFSDVTNSNWNVFQNPNKIIAGYTYKELLKTVYDVDNNPIWTSQDKIWNGSRFV